jgi:two-component system sensor histidine kinase/response regulator
MTPAQTTPTNATILIVEDNEDLRENATLVLALEGYNVFSACDGQEAIELLTSGSCRPDLIVSDIAMPRLDGYQFFRAVHEIPELRVVPFIFLTARGSARDIRFGKQLGVDDYLPKPFNADDFLVAVENKLRRTQEIRDHAENELDDARRAMVQLLSHELRTPLTYVTGGFSLLVEGLEQDKLPDEMRVSMGLIHSGTQRLNRLAEQMVLYAELINGHAKMQLESAGTPVDLESLLKDLIVTADRKFWPRHIRFVYHSHVSEPLKVLTVAELLTNAIYEVVRNAATYCDEGSEVTISLSLEQNEAVIAVSDHGWGIPVENRATIWNVMVQSERTKYEQQGAGMGLPITKRIFLVHGGSVTLDSQVGEGTLVTLRIPVYRPKERGSESR